MRRLWSFRDMKASTWFLVVSGAVIGVLVVVTVVLVLVVGHGGSITLLPEDTPEGVVQRLFLALEAEDYREAYSYLSSAVREEESYQSWSRPLVRDREGPEWTVTLGESSVAGYGATVEVTYTRFYPNTPLLEFIDPISTSRITFYLEREGSSWGITSPTWFWFLLY